MPACRCSWKTPLSATFFSFITGFYGCTAPATITQLPASACEQESTPIALVQGAGFQSPMLERRVTIRGIATFVTPGEGLFIEQPLSDTSTKTSDGLYLDSAGLASRVRVGDRLVVAGIVTELGEGSDTLTALTGINGFRVCASSVPLPISETRLPLSAQERESLEAMHVGMQQALMVTDVFRLRTGQISVSRNDILPAPTEVARPGPDARDQAARNRRAVINVRLADGDRQRYAVGTGVLALQGVIGHDGRSPQLRVKTDLPTLPLNIYRIPEVGEDEIRIIGLNLLNYFNGDGHGGGFPTARGAKTPAEFSHQRGRLSAAIGQIGPHMVGVMELENDGFGPGSAAQDFLDDLQSATGHPWAVVNPNDAPVGSNAITVGIFYRSDILQTAGKAGVFTAPPFERLSRRPVAQVFIHKPSGDNFMVVVNHLKSKGSCPQQGRNSNLHDGQGCWNLARVEAARAMSAWVKSLAITSDASRVLILGDMNAYRMEDPIAAIIDAGFKDLTASSGLRPLFSYIYSGRAGTLDYAFASPELLPHVRIARILNINSPYPRDMDLPLPWLGSSDHDPVVVDLRFRQAATWD